MKNVLFILFSIFSTLSSFAQHSLEKIWETDSVLKNPESALYVAKSNILYVSSIGDFQKEGVGFISKIGLDGKIINRNWVTGLNAPKGLGLYNNLLYAAEPTAVAVINVNTAKIINRIPIEGAQFLNDIAIDSKGIVYVSDTKTNKVHKIQEGKPSIYLENMKSANGLLAIGNELYVLTDSVLQKSDGNKNLTTLVRGIEGGADGIEMIAPHQFIITGWAGVVYFAKDDGFKQTLLDKRSEGINSADLGYNPSTNTLFIPAMLKNKIIAYKLK